MEDRIPEINDLEKPLTNEKGKWLSWQESNLANWPIPNLSQMLHRTGARNLGNIGKSNNCLP